VTHENHIHQIRFSCREDVMPARKSATSQPPLRVAIVGCGGMARHHAAAMLRHQDIVQIPAVCEPSSSTYARFAELFHDVGVTPPPNYPDLAALLQNAGGALDAAFIITPHALHHDQAAACMEAGLDVLLEKPMVMNTAEARSLIATRDRTGRRLVVAFNGSLSPQIRTAVKLLRSGELGEILNIHGVVWQGWNGHTQNTWRQAPAIAGGGFLFDTGAHLLNTVADLAGEPVVEVAAWLDNRGRPVDILGSVMARLASGVLITLSGCGDTIESCASDVRVFCTQGILRTGVWGRNAGGAACGRGRSGAGECARVTWRLGTVPARLSWRDRQPQPAGSRVADGDPLGYDPHLGAARGHTGHAARRRSLHGCDGERRGLK
jgi:predicted dehydrogenase